MKLSLGRFRKGKKALRSPRRRNSSKKIALAVRYQSHLVRVERLKESIQKIIMAGLIQANSLAQVAAIRAKTIPHFVSEEEKNRLRHQRTLAIAEIAFDSCRAINIVFSDNIIIPNPTA